MGWTGHLTEIALQAACNIKTGNTEPVQSKCRSGQRQAMISPPNWQCSIWKAGGCVSRSQREKRWEFGTERNLQITQFAVSNWTRTKFQSHLQQSHGGSKAGIAWANIANKKPMFDLCILYSNNSAGEQMVTSQYSTLTCLSIANLIYW